MKTLGWIRETAQKKARALSHMGEAVKLVDGSYGAVIRIHFSESYTRSHRTVLLKDGGHYTGQWLVDTGKIDPAWEKSVADRNMP